MAVDPAQHRLVEALVERLNPAAEVGEMRRLRVASRDSAPVPARPVRLAHAGFAYLLMELALRLDGDREPFQAGRCLDHVSISPVATGELGIVVEHKLVDRIYQVEIALPGDVVRLAYRD